MVLHNLGLSIVALKAARVDPYELQPLEPERVIFHKLRICRAILVFRQR